MIRTAITAAAYHGICSTLRGRALVSLMSNSLLRNS